MDAEIKNIKQILLVEDDPADLQLTLAALEEYHLINRIVIVRDGAQALDYLYRRGEFSARTGDDPALVLLDLKMPKVNGLEVLRTIKADTHLKIIPVVVLSSSGEPTDLIECYKQGFNSYMVKPVEVAEFMKAVKHLGIFWGAINEPPPLIGRDETKVPTRAEIVSPLLPVERNLPRRILVVDDERYSRQITTDALIRAGYEVDPVADGAAGWDALQTKHYDLLITDNSMPKVTGVELLKMLRGQNPTLPVIMATGAIPTEEKERDAGLNIHAVLLKPYSITVLLETVKEVLRATEDAREQTVSRPGA